MNLKTLLAGVLVAGALTSGCKNTYEVEGLDHNVFGEVDELPDMPDGSTILGIHLRYPYEIHQIGTPEDEYYQRWTSDYHVSIKRKSSTYTCWYFDEGNDGTVDIFDLTNYPLQGRYVTLKAGKTWGINSFSKFEYLLEDIQRDYREQRARFGLSYDQDMDKYWYKKSYPSSEPVTVE